MFQNYDNVSQKSSLDNLHGVDKWNIVHIWFYPQRCLFIYLWSARGSSYRINEFTVFIVQYVSFGLCLFDLARQEGHVCYYINEILLVFIYCVIF